MTNYFRECRTIEDVKQVYKKLARDLHPDCNPGRDTTAEFQEMGRQYEEAYNRLRNVHRNAEGETYEKETQQTAAEYADLINQLLHIPGLIIELCGSWLWISGDTRNFKDYIKATGCKWSGKKKMWYWHPGDFKRRGHGWTIERIRERFGSEALEFANAPEVAIPF